MNRIRTKWNQVPLTVKVSVSYAACSILQHCLSFITLPIFIRLLTKEQYGQFTVYSSWMAILPVFLTLNLSSGSFATAMVKFDGDRDGYISAVEGICLLLSAAFLLLYLPFRGLWNRLFEMPTVIVALLVAEIVGMTAIQLWSGRNRFEFKYKNVIAVTLGIAVTAPLLGYILVMNTEEKGYARIIGYAVPQIAVGAFFFIREAVKGKKLFNGTYWKYAFGFNVPLLAYYLSQSIFNQSDRIMISHMVGTDKAAVYGVAYAFGTILIFALNAINNSYVPWYYGKIKEGKQRENRPVSTGIALLMSVLLSGVIWFAPEIIRLMAGEQYAEAVHVVPPVAVSILLLFYSQLFINVEFFYEQKKMLVGASIGAALSNLILNWIFIQKYGFIAAAYTTLVSYMIFAFFNYRAMAKILKSKGIADNAYDYAALILIFAVFCALSAAGSLLYGFLPARILVSAAVLIGLFVKRNYFLDIYRTTKKKKEPEQ